MQYIIHESLFFIHFSHSPRFSREETPDIILGLNPGITRVVKLKPNVYRGYLAPLKVIDDNDDDYDDVHLRLQHGKGFHNLVYMSYVKHINPASKA
jgi:hypothetical protein